MTEQRAPGYVMRAPVGERLVWVRAADRAEWEGNGYTVVEDRSAPPVVHTEPAIAAPSEAEDAPPAASASEEPSEIEAPAPPVVSFPRRRGGNTAPRG